MSAPAALDTLAAKRAQSKEEGGSSHGSSEALGGDLEVGHGPRSSPVSPLFSLSALLSALSSPLFSPLPSHSLALPPQALRLLGNSNFECYSDDNDDLLDEPQSNDSFGDMLAGPNSLDADLDTCMSQCHSLNAPANLHIAAVFKSVDLAQHRHGLALDRHDERWPADLVRTGHAAVRPQEKAGCFLVLKRCLSSLKHRPFLAVCRMAADLSGASVRKPTVLGPGGVTLFNTIAPVPPGSRERQCFRARRPAFH